MTPNIAEGLVLAWTHYKVGRFAMAEEVYRQIVLAAPAHAQAWCLLGTVCQQQGKLADAVSSYQEALRLRPGYTEAYFNLGHLFKGQGQRDAAIWHFQQALCSNVKYAAAFRELQALLDTVLAIPVADKQLRLLYGQAHYNLGVVSGMEGHISEAIVHYRRSLAYNADDVQTHNNLANALSFQGQLDEAVVSYREALRCKPDCAEAHNNLGTALTRLGRLHEAVESFRRVVQLDPNFAEVYVNLGEALKDLGRPEALANFEEALRLKPGFAAARWNRALVWLLAGDFEKGWPEYEWRWMQTGTTRRPFSQPLWDGAALNGRTILVHAEQGLGDTIQFVRYLPRVSRCGGRVIFECQQSLCQLLTGFSGIDLLVPRGSPLPAFDVQVPLLSLPGIFRTSLETIPAPIPYLFANPTLVERWHSLRRPGRGLDVGIAWQGSTTFMYDKHRSFPLTTFAPIARVDGVRLISLQRGQGTEQLRALNNVFPVLDIESQMGNDLESFMNIAAIMKNLDLVIACDTSIAHLAGALGVPVWLALPLVPDWRWLLQRADSPWYPSMRLFRQTEFGNWAELMERMAVQMRGIQKSSG